MFKAYTYNDKHEEQLVTFCVSQDDAVKEFAARCGESATCFVCETDRSGKLVGDIVRMVSPQEMAAIAAK